MYVCSSLFHQDVLHDDEIFCAIMMRFMFPLAVLLMRG